MEYKEKYEDFLDKMQGLLKKAEEQGHIIVRVEDLYNTFPELKESEDERIRKELLRFIKNWKDPNNQGRPDDFPMFTKNEEQCNAYIAWLEKQESVGEIVERCKNSWYNEGKIQGQIEGLSDDEKYQQGWHDALEKQSTPNQEPDGIYLVLNNGKHVLFTGHNNSDECAACIGIGVKSGSKSIVVELYDQAADGIDITLTTNKDKGGYAGYIDNHSDAVADWNGKANTEHLKETGLNKFIYLPDGWYIPSLGELYFVFLNRKAINEALEYVGGKTIDGSWFWTSTEYSATRAWRLYLYDGNSGNYPKTASTARVRAVSAFIS